MHPGGERTKGAIVNTSSWIRAEPRVDQVVLRPGIRGVLNWVPGTHCALPLTSEDLERSNRTLCWKGGMSRVPAKPWSVSGVNAPVWFFLCFTSPSLF